MYDFKYKQGHIEVFYNGKFLFAADDMKEAIHDIEMQEKRLFCD